MGHEETGKNKVKEVQPSFSSPWCPSSCSAKRMMWKDVEDYNRQRKRMRFLGWATEEEVSSCSSTACSDHPESLQSSDGDEGNDPSKRLDISTQNQPLVVGEAEDEPRTGEMESRRGFQGLKASQL